MKVINIFIFILLLSVLLSDVAFSQASSDQYRLTAGLTIGGGGQSTSPGYTMTGAVLTASGGKSTSTNYILNGGAPVTTVADIDDDDDNLGGGASGGGGGSGACFIGCASKGFRDRMKVLLSHYFLPLYQSVCIYLKELY